MNKVEVKVAVACQSAVRYSFSEEELKEFEEIILRKIEKHKITLKDCLESASNNNGNGTEDTSPTFKVLEEGNRTQEKEVNTKLAQHQQRQITSLENALFRINNGTFGKCRCRECNGKLINKNHLLACPQMIECLGSSKGVKKQPHKFS